MITMMNLVFPLIIILVSAGIVFSKAESSSLVHSSSWRKMWHLMESPTKGTPIIMLGDFDFIPAKGERNIFSENKKIVVQAYVFIPQKDKYSEYIFSFKVKGKNSKDFESICDVSFANQADVNFKQGCYCIYIGPYFVFVLNSTVNSLVNQTKIQAVVKKNMEGEVAYSEEMDILLPSKKEPFIFLYDFHVTEEKDESLEQFVYMAFAFIPSKEKSSQYTFSFQVKQKNSTKFESICDVSLANQDDVNYEHGCFYKKLGLFYIFILNSTVQPLLNKTKIQAVIKKNMDGAVAHSHDWNIVIPSEKATQLPMKEKPSIYFSNFYRIQTKSEENVSEQFKIVFEAFAHIPRSENSSQYKFSFQVKHKNSNQIKSICDISIANHDDVNCETLCYIIKYQELYTFRVHTSVHDLLGKSMIQAVIKNDMTGEVAHSQIITFPSKKRGTALLNKANKDNGKRKQYIFL